MELLYVSKVAAMRNLASIISSVQQSIKNIWKEGTYCNRHCMYINTDQLQRCKYIKSHLPTNVFAQSSTHEQDQLCEMTVCHIALQRYSDSQLHLCWKAVCRQAFLFDSCSKATAVLSIALFLLSTCTFFNMLQHLEDLRDKGK